METNGLPTAVNVIERARRDTRDPLCDRWETGVSAAG
jgi:hypothetical protein